MELGLGSNHYHYEKSSRLWCRRLQCLGKVNGWVRVRVRVRVRVTAKVKVKVVVMVTDLV